MAQPKVTEYFRSRKRTADFQPSKRQKLREPGDLSCGDAIVKHLRSGVVKAPVEPSQELLQKKQGPQKSKRLLAVKPRKSKRLGDLQTTIPDLYAKTSKDNTDRLPDSDSTSAEKTVHFPVTKDFTFSCKADLPSDPDISVTEYHISGSPHSTPSKRTKLASLEPSTSRKRKRKSDVICPGEVTPSTRTPVIPPMTPAKQKTKKVVCKKLNLSTGSTTAASSGDDVNDLQVAGNAQITLANSPEPAPSISFSDAKESEAGVELEVKHKQPVERSATSSATSTATISTLPSVESGYSKPGVSSSKPSSKHVSGISTEDKIHSSDHKKNQCEDNSQVQSNPKSQPSTSSSRSKGAPNPGELKAMLAKCGKLSDLKTCLQKVQGLTKELKEKKATKTTTSIKEPVKEKNAVPAHEKYKDLAAKIPPTLTLPFKYKVLEDMFRGADTVISIMYNRLERCTFSKLKRAVQDMVRKNFEPKHLGQIKTVYPRSYEVRQEKGVVESGIRSDKYTMTVEPIIEAKASEEKVSKRKDGKPVFSSNEIVKRKSIFRSRLFDIVKMHHQRFLQQLEPPLNVESEKVVRWHPKFLLDNVPDIEVAELPAPPESAKEQLSAKDVLKISTGRLPNKVEQALKAVADATERAKKLNLVPIPNASNPPTKQSAQAREAQARESNRTRVDAATSTSGISSSLLERIRMKEALQAQADMLRDEDSEREMEILDRLPEMIKILRSFFVTEKKPALEEDRVIVKLCDSYKSTISQSSVEKHIDYMLKELPDWIARVTVRSGRYLKINRQTELSTVNSKISKLLKQKRYQVPR